MGRSLGTRKTICHFSLNPPFPTEKGEGARTLSRRPCYFAPVLLRDEARVQRIDARDGILGQNMPLHGLDYILAGETALHGKFLHIEGVHAVERGRTNQGLG